MYIHTLGLGRVCHGCACLWWCNIEWPADSPWQVPSHQYQVPTPVTAPCPILGCSLPSCWVGSCKCTVSEILFILLIVCLIPSFLPQKPWRTLQPSTHISTECYWTYFQCCKTSLSHPSPATWISHWNPVLTPCCPFLFTQLHTHPQSPQWYSHWQFWWFQGLRFWQTWCSALATQWRSWGRRWQLQLCQPHAWQHCIMHACGTTTKVYLQAARTWIGTMRIIITTILTVVPMHHDSPFICTHQWHLDFTWMNNRHQLEFQYFVVQQGSVHKTNMIATKN